MECTRMSRPSQCFASASKKILDLGVFGHVQRQDDFALKFRGHSLDTSAQFLGLVVERQLGTLGF